MTRFRLLALSLLSAAACAGPAFPQDVPPPHTPPSVIPHDDPIRLPDLTPEQPAVPVPAVGAPIKLNATNVYMFDTDVEVVVRVNPAGLVAVTKEDGPVRQRDVFADNPSGRKTLRNFKGKYVFTVVAVSLASGTCDLTVIPTGLKSEKEIKSKTFEVNGGIPPAPPVPPGPIPPGPTPPTPPVPDPSVVTNPFGDLPGLRVLIVYETGSTLPIGQQPVLFGKSVRDYLDAHCPVGPDGATKEWRIYDQNVTGLENEAPTWKAVMAKPRAGVPWLYVGNGKAGESVALPKTVEETLTLLRKYGGA